MKLLVYNPVSSLSRLTEFARTALVRPITVNVCRAGAANLDVVQEVEYVKPEAKVVYLLECLQKTPPPVMIFSEKKADVDDIHEYLLLKGKGREGKTKGEKKRETKTETNRKRERERDKDRDKEIKRRMMNDALFVD